MDFIDYEPSSPDMKFPTTDNSNDGPTPQLSENDHVNLPLTLASFIPILEKLPGLYLEQNSYYIRGSITTADWTQIRNYTRSVSKFILTDVNKDSQARISPTALLRLARFQQPSMLPSLSDIVIVDADASIDYLELLIKPSLKSLEASCIPDAQQSTFFSFLTAIEQEVPLLQTIILGPGQFSPSSLQIISQFKNLCHLELKNEGPEIPSAFFDNIGSLPKLETFVLDARHVFGTVTKNQPNSTEETTVPLAFKNIKPLPCGSFPDSYSVMLNKSVEDGGGDILPSQTCYPTSGTFSQLTKLHITGWLPLLQDLIPRIMSTKLEDVSVTLVRLPYDEWLAKVKADEEKRNKDHEEREAKKRYEEQRKRDEEKHEAEFGKKKKKKRTGMWGEELPSNDSEEEQNILETQNMLEARERLLKEQEKLASLSFHIHTASFTDILRTLCCRWTAGCLKAVSVCQLGTSFQTLLNPPTLPGRMFQELLLFPAIESLEVKGWALDSVESVINTSESIPNLESLLLPLDETNSGISLHTLRHIAKICPKLESFQCRIEPLFLIPEYDIPTTEALSHGLQILSVGNSSPLSNAKRLYLIARHLYLLFPNLKTINTFPEYNAEQWVFVDELVKMCQTARIDDSMNCLSAP